MDDPNIERKISICSRNRGTEDDAIVYPHQETIFLDDHGKLPAPEKLVLVVALYHLTTDGKDLLAGKASRSTQYIRTPIKDVQLKVGRGGGRYTLGIPDESWFD